ncbi:MAG: tRNA (cytidine32/uridine32-2'-O)-methyltransferase [Polyangiales bacterium]|jgi:tRNA (cytidine32/uridine32-2'-O)-methyltransferase
MDTLDHIRVVLVEPEHPGNIGAAARAMANMGLRHLVLVSPNDFPSYEANARASGAPTLQHARVVETLDEALTDCTMVIAASARVRTIPWPQQSAGEAMGTLMNHPGQSALVFGRESTGLTNEELDRCQFQTRIPVDEAFSSMNLGCAVSVLLYELRRQALAVSPVMPSPGEPEDLATSSDLRHFYDHLGTILDRSDPGGRFSNRLRVMTRIFNRASVTSLEIRLLRGVLSSIDAQLKD